jgi:uncharacterized protein (DUF924 family)
LVYRELNSGASWFDTSKIPFNVIERETQCTVRKKIISKVGIIVDVRQELERLHEHWFGGNPAQGVPEEKIAMWFQGGEETDRRLAESFGELHSTVTSGGGFDDLVTSLETSRQTVGLILLLDQLSRHIYRGTPKAFDQDDRARELALKMVRSREDRGLSMWERSFVYLPFEHSENREDQQRCVDLFEELVADAPDRWTDAAEEFLEYARNHRDVIEEFGRFPHRNEILGRESTPDESAYLDQPGSGF